MTALIMENDSVYDDYRIVVVKWNGQYLKHRCGYVGLPDGHPLIGVGYDESTPVFDGRSPEDVLNVHGGLTFSEDGKMHIPVNIEPPCKQWYGFDCAHCGDTPEQWTKDAVFCECVKLVAQLKEVKGA